VEPEYALNRNSTLMEALHLMNSRGARILVVVDGDLVVGLITRRRLHGEIINLAKA
jgi:CBS domain-containing protein